MRPSFDALHFLEDVGISAKTDPAESRRSPAGLRTTASFHFSPIRGLDASLIASGSVYMNERPKLGSDQGGLNVHLWVTAAYQRRNAHSSA